MTKDGQKLKYYNCSIFPSANITIDCRAIQIHTYFRFLPNMLVKKQTPRCNTHAQSVKIDIKLGSEIIWISPDVFHQLDVLVFLCLLKIISLFHFSHLFRLTFWWMPQLTVVVVDFCFCQCFLLPATSFVLLFVCSFSSQTTNIL